MATKAKGKSAADKKDARRSTWRVKEGQTVTTRERGDDGEMRNVVYEAGDEVELTDDEAEDIAHAVDKDQKVRPGHISRLKQQIETLKAQLNDEKTRHRATKDELDDIRESFLNRGDNYIGRGEPTPGGVPQEVIDAHERNLIASEFGLDDGDDADDEALDTEKLSGGMKGLGREKAGADSAKGPASGSGSGSQS